MENNKLEENKIQVLDADIQERIVNKIIEDKSEVIFCRALVGSFRKNDFDETTDSIIDYINSLQSKSIKLEDLKDDLKIKGLYFD